MTAKVRIVEDGFIRDGQVVSDDERVHVLFYREGAGQAGEDTWTLPTIARRTGEERYMTVLVIVGNELKANARRLVRDGRH